MKRWLGEVGFKMQQRRRAGHGTDQDIVIDGDTLRSWLGSAMAETGRPPAADDVRRFLDIIKRRSGLVIERGDNQFAFTHLSFQEYFAAVYLADWVTSAEWLLGEEVPFGTAAADLQQYADEGTWEETLVFLFELLAGAKPLGKQKIREAVFGSDWSAVTGESDHIPETASLLARLTSDPHVNWDHDTNASAVERCLAILAEYHDWEDIHYSNEDADLSLNVLMANISILRPLLSGEPSIRRARLQRLADRWVSAGRQRLSLRWMPVDDLAPLAGLTNLQCLILDSTPVIDLAPLAGLSGLTTLSLQATRVDDLSPLAGLTNLQCLILDSTPVDDLAPLAGLSGLTTLSVYNTKVDDLSPLAGLTRLTTLSLVSLGRSTRVTEDEVAKLKACLPALEIRG